MSAFPVKAKIVLDDDLFEVYALFRSGIFDKIHVNTLEKLISFLKLEVAFPTPSQMRAIRKKYSDYRLPYIENIAPSVASSALPCASLEELAMQTIHKIILTEEKTKIIPYVNIHEKKIESLYTMACKPDEDRGELLAHIKNLCQSANEICVCDMYLQNIIETKWNGKNYFAEIFPDKNLNLYCSEKGFPQHEDKIRNAIKKIIKGKEWKVCLNRTTNSFTPHDRYIRIDKKYEIMLSSGFQYLFDKSKEITCVFREIP